MRAEYAAGGTTHRALAAKYGVHHTVASKAISGKTYHLDDATEKEPQDAD